MPIPEAFAVKAGEIALVAALRAATACLEQARASGHKRVDVCIQYLGAASIAIRGLEQELQSIAVEADNCDLTSPFARRALRLRIGMFLYVDRLRPVLWEAVSGLRASEASLAADPKGFFQGLQRGVRVVQGLPGEEEEHDALEELKKTLEEIDGYVRSLSFMYDDEGNNATGPHGAHFLRKLYELLPRPDEPEPDERTREEISQQIQGALGLAKTQLRTHTENITKTIRTVDKTFWL